MTICEVNDALRAQVEAEYQVKGFASLSDALATGPEAAVIATPAHTHILLARQVAEAGVHLMIEKPLAVCSEGVERLAQAIRERKLTANVAYVYRAHPLLSAMRQEILGGRWGKPLEVIGVSGQYFPLYRPAYRQTYYVRHEHGGGAIQDAITHILNAAEWLVGPIDRLTVDADHQALEGVDVEDTVHILARHGNVQGAYLLNQHQAPNETTLTVICQRGTVRFELHNNRWRWMVEASGQWHDETIPPMQRDDWFTCQENAFLDALEGKRPVLCTLEEGLQTLKVNQAALRMAMQGNGMARI